MNNYKIDKGMPVPESRKSKWRPFVARMEHGDSVLVENKKEADRLSSAIHHEGYKCRVRQQPGKKYRVWKIDPEQDEQ